MAVIAVLLTILKIIGIVLLVLLFLLLAAVCIILFVPIRYEASGEMHGAWNVRFRVSWIMRMLRIDGHIDQNGLQYRAKALGKTLKESNDEGTA